MKNLETKRMNAVLQTKYTIVKSFTRDILFNKKPTLNGMNLL